MIDNKLADNELFAGPRLLDTVEFYVSMYAET